jgi:hypothetical protein
MSVWSTAPAGGCGGVPASVGGGVAGVAGGVAAGVAGGVAVPAGGAGSGAAGMVPAGGADTFWANDGTAKSASSVPKNANRRCLLDNGWSFGSNLNGLRARPRTGRENTQIFPGFKDARTHPVGTS